MAPAPHTQPAPHQLENARLKTLLAQQRQLLAQRRRVLARLLGDTAPAEPKGRSSLLDDDDSLSEDAAAACPSGRSASGGSFTQQRRPRLPTLLDAANIRLAFAKLGHARLGSRCPRAVAQLSEDLQQSVGELALGKARPVDLYPFGFTRTGSVSPLDISQEWRDSVLGSPLASEAESLSWGTAVCESKVMSAGVFTASFQLGGSCHAILGVCRNDALDLTTNSVTTSSLAWTTRSCGYSAADGAAVGRRLAHPQRRRSKEQQRWADPHVNMRRRTAKVGSVVRLKLDLIARKLTVTLDGVDCGAVCSGDDIPLPVTDPESAVCEADAELEADLAPGLIWFAALGPNSRGQAVRVVSSLPGGSGGPVSPRRRKLQPA